MPQGRRLSLIVEDPRMLKGATGIYFRQGDFVWQAPLFSAPKGVEAVKAIQSWQKVQDAVEADFVPVIKEVVEECRSKSSSLFSSGEDKGTYERAANWLNASNVPQWNVRLQTHGYRVQVHVSKQPSSSTKQPNTPTSSSKSQGRKKRRGSLSDVWNQLKEGNQFGLFLSLTELDGISKLQSPKKKDVLSPKKKGQISPKKRSSSSKSSKAYVPPPCPVSHRVVPTAPIPATYIPSMDPTATPVLSSSESALNINPQELPAAPFQDSPRRWWSPDRRRSGSVSPRRQTRTEDNSPNRFAVTPTRARSRSRARAKKMEGKSDEFDAVGEERAASRSRSRFAVTPTRARSRSRARAKKMEGKSDEFDAVGEERAASRSRSRPRAQSRHRSPSRPPSPSRQRSLSRQRSRSRPRSQSRHRSQSRQRSKSRHRSPSLLGTSSPRGTTPVRSRADSKEAFFDSHPVTGGGDAHRCTSTGRTTSPQRAVRDGTPSRDRQSKHKNKSSNKVTDNNDNPESPRKSKTSSKSNKPCGHVFLRTMSDVSTITLQAALLQPDHQDEQTHRDLPPCMEDGTVSTDPSTVDTLPTFYDDSENALFTKDFEKRPVGTTTDQVSAHSTLPQTPGEESHLSPRPQRWHHKALSNEYNKPVQQEESHPNKVEPEDAVSTKPVATPKKSKKKKAKDTKVKRKRLMDDGGITQLGLPNLDGPAIQQNDSTNELERTGSEWIGAFLDSIEITESNEDPDVLTVTLPAMMEGSDMLPVPECSTRHLLEQ